MVENEIPTETNVESKGIKRISKKISFVPPPIRSIKDIGISQLWIQELILKILYFQGNLSGYQIAEQIALPFGQVVDKLLDAIKREKLVEIQSTQIGLGEGAYIYTITEAGITRAREALLRSQYAGPTPVPLDAYIDACRKQARGRLTVTSETMEKALLHLVLNEDVFHRIGPAVNSGTSIFLYGPSGNGKTTIASSLGKLLSHETMYIPHALYVDGQIVKLYDSVNHQIAKEDDGTIVSTGSLLRIVSRRDVRWVKIHRPTIIVGGELTLDGLDLVFDDVNKYYEAPFQVKANGGILLIDDFGRQLVRPRDLLNRWIVPLENRIDYLTLHTGRKIEVPFDVLIIFSTNLPPRDLVDEAFLRRLRHKIMVGDPTFDAFREIFQRVAESYQIPYNDEGLSYLIQKWYIKQNRKIRASHPRDICNQILDISRYWQTPPSMTKEMIDKAAQSYFVVM